MINSVPLTAPIELLDVTPFNPLISKVQIKVCWVGDEANPNHSIISKETAVGLANSLPGSPIVGYYNEATGDFEEHNKIIEIKNGQFRLKPTTQPYGFVDLNAKVWFQKFSDEGVEREYLCTEGWLWTGQFPECQRVIENGNNQSMELSEEYLNAYWTKDANGKREFFIINEAIMSKLCILGEDVKPAFAGAQITTPKIEFSFEDDFKNQMFSMMNEIKNILKEGGVAPMFTTYAVEIGDSLWSALYSYLEENFSDGDSCCSVYRIEGIYEEGDGAKFAIIQNREDMTYYRFNLSLTEAEGFAVIGALVEVTKTYVPSATPQFDPAAVEAFATSYAEAKKPKDEETEEEEEEEVCPECGKPLSECTCEEEEEEEKTSYILEEIPEYVELQANYAELENSLNEVKATCEALTTELEELREFKAKADRQAKEDMINTFYMLSEEDKKDVVDNIDSYSLSDIEAKLSILCVRNKVSFNLDEDNKSQEPVVYSLAGGGSNSAVDTPDWVKALQEVAKTL